MASRLRLVSRKVKVIQGSPRSESGAKLFLMSPLIIWKQSHVQAWPTKGVFSKVHFQYYGEKNSITKTQKFSKREGVSLEKSFNIFCGQIKLNMGDIPSFFHIFIACFSKLCVLLTAY